MDKLAFRIITFKRKLKIRQLQDLEIFIAAADLGSLSAAARQLGHSSAVASAALKRLESGLGAALFARSTRSLRLTPEGERLLESARPSLELLREAEADLAGNGGIPAGRLQISLPSDLGRNQLLAWLDDFVGGHPGLELRVRISDRVDDLYRQAVDIAIRYGTLPDSSLVALPLAAANRRALFASPAYLARCGSPAAPADLAHHNCLRFFVGDSVNERWRFFRDGRAVEVCVRGDRIADDADAVRRWAIAGLGIGCKSLLDIVPDLAAGRLVLVCPDWQGEALPLSLLCPGRRQLSPIVSRLRKFLAERCERSLAPWIEQPR